MAKKKRPGVFILSVRKQNQDEVLPILEHLRTTGLGISRTICQLLMEHRDRGYKFDQEVE